MRNINELGASQRAAPEPVIERVRTKIPTKSGFYWAQWRISDHDHELPPIGIWEVVDLNINGGDPKGREYMKVSICGVERPESPENFVWGEGPLKAPGRILS